MIRKIGLALASIAIMLSAPAHAAWEFKILEDPMTDARRGIASVMGDEGLLVVKCDSNGPESLYISIISKHYLGGTSRSRSRDVRFRIDRGTPQSISASHDGSSASIFDLQPGKAGGVFLSQILDARELVVQVTSFDYDSYTIVFDTTGARSAVEKAASACRDTHWAPAAAAGTAK